LSKRSIYRYEVATSNLLTSEYIAAILRLYGLCYDWHPASIPELGGHTVELSVREASSSHNVVTQSTVRFRVLITTDERMLLKANITPVSTDAASFHYACLQRDGLPADTIPLPSKFMAPFNPALPFDWITVAQCYTNHLLGPLAVVSVGEASGSAVIGVDLLGMLDQCLLGPRDSGGLVVDTAELYGHIAPVQSLANSFFLHKLLVFIQRLLIGYFVPAFPVLIEPYPPGKQAPIIITGDSDDATPRDLDEYFRCFEQRGLRCSVMLRDIFAYPVNQLHDAVARGHCFGIHPYSVDATGDELRKDYSGLIDGFCEVFGRPPEFVRHHRFQWLGRATTLEIQRAQRVTFDLNCVAASGATWLGSGSGAALPIPYPPIGEDWLREPLHLPTCIEDDVLLYDLDYCYRPFVTGDCSAVDAAIATIERYARHRAPAVLNLHPEHMRPPYSSFVTDLADYLQHRPGWYPTLEGYHQWLSLFSAVQIRVGIEQRIEVEAACPVTVSDYHTLESGF
jgi:hypothetical protein